ncbi:unnamed protein product [Urochloa humidicola]
MALDLNFPASEDEQNDPFGGLPHGQEDPPLAGAHQPLAGAHPMEDAYGAAAFDLNIAAPESVHEMDGFIAPTTASNFDLNFDLEEEEEDEDADVYAHDFHVIFADEGTCSNEFFLFQQF